VGFHKLAPGDLTSGIAQACANPLQTSASARQFVGGLDPGGGIAEVEDAGTVEGFLWGADGVAGGQDVLIVVVAGAVDRKSPLACGPAVAQPAQRCARSVGQDRVEVGETGPVPDVDTG
jgi:hypothetical protein